MNGLETKNITLPREVAKEITTKARDSSVIQTLSSSTPQLFRDMNHIVFTKEPEAEFIGESQEKSPSTVEFTPVPSKPHKAQVTVRISDEVKWADEDNQLQIIDSIIDASSAAIGRALDFGIIHGISPLVGNTFNSAELLTENAHKIDATDNPAKDLDNLVGKINEEYEVTGVALSKPFANALRRIRVKETGMRLFPEIPLNLKTGTIDGIPAATSSTVGGKLKHSTYDPRVLAILGDFNLIKWGIVRDLGLDIITMGDPDGQGDLKRLNQVAYRLEVVYSWAILDYKGFAVLNDPYKPSQPPQSKETENGQKN